MTIAMTLVGIVVFIISLFTAGFKKAFKRLLMFIATGFTIDLLLVALGTSVFYLALA